MNLVLDPNLAYVLLVSGFVLAVLALFSPGTGVVEVGALFALMIAGYGVATLPTNWWALVILVIGVFPFVLALRRSQRWVYLIISLVALVVGSVFLFRSVDGGPAVNMALAVLTSASAIGILWIVTQKGLQAVRMRPAMDLGTLVGKLGEAQTDVLSDGCVYVGGEEWTARSAELIPKGTAIRVIGREGLVLLVEAVSPQKR